MTQKKSLGKRELMIMNIIWDRSEASVRDVFKEILQNEEVAYTTILSMMQKLEKKGFLSHREEGRTYIYAPVIQRNEIETNMLQELVESLFRGSYLNLVNTVIKNKKLSPAKVEELMQKIDREA